MPPSTDPADEGIEAELSEVAADATEDYIDLGLVSSDVLKIGLGAYQPRFLESTTAFSKIIAETYQPHLLKIVSGFSNAFTDLYRSQLPDLASGFSKIIADTYQPHLLETVSGFSNAFTDLYRPQLLDVANGFSKIFADTYQPQLSAIMAQFGSVVEAPYWNNITALGSLSRNLHVLAISNPVASQIGQFVGEAALTFNDDVRGVKPSNPRIGNREVGATLTVTVFLFVYIALGLAIKHSSELAKLAATDGPTPFEAAMAAGAFTFWAWMTYSNRSSDD